MVSFEKLRKDAEIQAYIKAADGVLDVHRTAVEFFDSLDEVPQRLEDPGLQRRGSALCLVVVQGVVFVVIVCGRVRAVFHDRVAEAFAHDEDDLIEKPGRVRGEGDGAQSVRE